MTATGKLEIPTGTTPLPVTLECDKTVGVTTAFVTLTGTTAVEGRSVRVTANDPNILLATTLKPPFKVKAAEADGGRRIPRGSTHLADVLIERTDGFTGELTLDMAGNQQRHRQGIRGPAFPVAPGQTKVAYPVFLPEWLETARTSRIGLVALAKVPDAKGTPRYVLDAMQGQITMSIEGALLKLSHAPAEYTAVCGRVLEVPLRLARAPQLTGPVTVELEVPRPLAGLLSAPPLVWPGDQSAASLRIASQDDPRLVGTWKLTARATGTRGGHPVVSETEFEVEFTRAKSGGR